MVEEAGSFLTDDLSTNESSSGIHYSKFELYDDVLFM